MKKTLIATLLLLGAAGSSCLGPDRLYSSMKNWNAQVSSEDWVNEVVFLGLGISMVYPFALLGDIVLFNTVAYWHDENLINDPGPFPGFAHDQE
jgi:hypothetical protein